MTETSKSKSEKEESLFPSGSLSVWPPLLRINNRGPDYYMKAIRTGSLYSNDLYLLSPKDKMENLTGYLHDKQTRLQYKSIELEWLAFLASKGEALLNLYADAANLRYDSLRGMGWHNGAINSWGGVSYSYEKLLWLVQGIFPFYDEIVEFSKKYESASSTESLLPKRTIQVFITFKSLVPKNSYWWVASKANPALKSPSAYKYTSISYEEASKASYEEEESEKFLIIIEPKHRGFIIDGIYYSSVYNIPEEYRHTAGLALIEFSNSLPRSEAKLQLEKEQEGWFFYESFL